MVGHTDLSAVHCRTYVLTLARVSTVIVWWAQSSMSRSRYGSRNQPRREPYDFDIQGYAAVAWNGRSRILDRVSRVL